MKGKISGSFLQVLFILLFVISSENHQTQSVCKMFFSKIFAIHEMTQQEVIGSFPLV